MDLATYLQGGGAVRGPGVPNIQDQPGTFQEAMRGWMMLRPHDTPGQQPWRMARPDPRAYHQPRLADIMAMYPGRNWHPAMQRMNGM